MFFLIVGAVLLCAAVVVVVIRWNDIVAYLRNARMSNETLAELVRERMANGKVVIDGSVFADTRYAVRRPVARWEGTETDAELNAALGRRDQVTVKL